MDFNRAIICGRLTADPIGKALETGTPVTTFSVASNRRWTKDGQQQEETEFHNVVAFGKLGQTCAAHLRKGHAALVEGRLKTRNWDQDGTRHYRTEIVVDRVVFGPRPDTAPAVEKTAPMSPSEVRKARMPEYPESEINPDDIPF